MRLQRNAKYRAFIRDKISLKLEKEIRSITLKKILSMQSRILILALEKIVPCHNPGISGFLCRKIENSSQIQDRFPRLSLADIFKKSLQVNVSTRR